MIKEIDERIAEIDKEIEEIMAMRQRYMS